MPVTIKTSTMKYKNASGTYVDINGVDSSFIDDSKTSDSVHTWSINKIKQQLALKADLTLRGAANGLAPLVNGHVPIGYLPSYVDDVVEYANRSLFPEIGEPGKIYIDLSTDICYRWGGTTYVAISTALVLGETNKSAYRGDRGKIAYDHAEAHGSEYNVRDNPGLYKIQTNDQGHVTNAALVTKQDITTLGIPDIKIVDGYNDQRLYKYDDYIYRRINSNADGHLYRCIQNFSETGPFDESQWEVVTLTEELAKIMNRLYQAMAVSSVSFVTPASGLVLMGNKIDAAAISVKYTFNKVPQSATINNSAISNPQLTGTVSPASGSWNMNTSSKAMTVAATDERGATTSRSVNLNFQNYVYYGTAPMPESVNDVFINSLVSTTSGNKVLTATAENSKLSFVAASGNYIWYAVPVRLLGGKSCAFTDLSNDFTGGFGYEYTTDVTNDSVYNNGQGYTESYRVYRSDQPGLTIDVKIKLV